MTNTIAKSRELSAFVVEETTKGTLAYPTAASEMLVLTEQPTLKQQPTFTDSKEINDTLDTTDRFQDQIGAGQFTFDFYNRPSGVAGDVPMGDILFESLQGGSTVSGGVSCTYDQSKIKKPFSAWFKQGHTVYHASGGCAETLKMALSNKGAFECNFGGGFMKKGWAGTDSANGATANGEGSLYVVDKSEGYAEGDTTITLGTGSGSILEGDIVLFADDSTEYYIATGNTEPGDIVLRAPGLTAALANTKAMTIIGNSKVTVTNGKLFTENSLVEIATAVEATANNSNEGYRILLINGNKLFFAEAITCLDEAVVKGFLPIGLTAIGAPVESKNNTISFDGVTKVLKTLTIDISSPVEWQNEEINASGYVEAYVESMRSIKVTAEALFREQDLHFLHDALNNKQIVIAAVMDGGAGKTCTINLPYTELEEPSESAGENTVSLSLSGVCLGAAAGENSSTIVFT